MELRAWSRRADRLFGMDDRRRRRSPVADMVVRSRRAGRLVGMNRRRRGSVVATMVVRSRRAGRTVGVNRRRRWGVVATMLMRTQALAGWVP